MLFLSYEIIIHAGCKVFVLFYLSGCTLLKIVFELQNCHVLLCSAVLECDVVRYEDDKALLSGHTATLCGLGYWELCATISGTITGLQYLLHNLGIMISVCAPFLICTMGIISLS